MSFFSQFRNVSEADKAVAIKKLIENSTPDYDFFVMVGLSVLMATLGVLLGSPAVVLGSMLIAPMLYPILSLGLGVTLADSKVVFRSARALIWATFLGVSLSAGATLLFRPTELTPEILSRIEPSIAYFMVAMISGFAASFALVRPQLSASFPGVAIAVALIPPLSVVGIGAALFNEDILLGAMALFVLNVIGIVISSMFSFSLLNIYAKRNVAETTLKREEARIEDEYRHAKELEGGENNI